MKNFSSHWNKRLKKGAISLELLLNFLIYFVIFIFLFTLAIIPIKIFYLKIAARDTAILYAELVHFSNANDLQSRAKYIMTGDKTNPEKITSGIVNVGENKNIKAIEINKGGEGTCRADVAKIVSYYITKNLFKEKTLPSLLFDPSKITITIDDSGCAQGNTPFKRGLNAVGDFFQGFVYTFSLDVNISYPIYIFRVVNLNLKPFNMTISGNFHMRYNK